MLWSASALPDLSRRTALVTGANSGIGKYTALGLAKAGADVIMACRNLDTAQKACSEIIEHGVDEGRLSIEHLDLASLANTRALADRIGRRCDRLDLLINNAGISASSLQRTEDGLESMIQVNYLAHVALTMDLLPLLAHSDQARVVSLASVAHFTLGALDIDDLNHQKRRFHNLTAYGQSKIAQLIFARELGRRLERVNLPVLSVAAHPGFSRTEIFDRSSDAMGLAARLTALYSQSAEAGAGPILRAATDAQARNGDYFGPLFGLVGPAVKTYSLPQSSDPATGKALWDRSFELLGMQEPAILDRA